MISEVVRFVSTDSCENGLTKEKVLAKCVCKSPFSKYPAFQSNGLEFAVSNANLCNNIVEEKGGF